MLIASFPETSEIGKRVAKRLGAEHTTIKASDFPDSEYYIRLKKNPRHKIVVIINSIIKDADEKIIESLLAGGIARDYHAKKVILVATYLPYMRQDAHFKNFDSFSAKYILKLFNGFDKIFVLDPHLHRIKSLKKISKKAERISANWAVASFIKKELGNKFGNYNIVGPDEESEQWSGEIAKRLGKKLIILKKERLGSAKVKMKSFGKKLGENIIIIDDIISTGSTFLSAIKIAKKQGAKKIACIGIHGIFAGNADKIIRKYADLVTTNSIPNKYARIDVSPVIAEALRKYK